MNQEMTFTVSDLARKARISVRTLHHYDELGLLAPSGRTEAGYRVYSEQDQQRLEQILFFKELSFSLEEIRRLLDDPAYDVRAALLRQRQLLVERGQQLEKWVGALDKALQAHDQGRPMTQEERQAVFGDFKPEDYEQEVQERWEHTEAFLESKRRSARYGKAEWERIKEEGAAVFRDLAALKAGGHSADSTEAMELAERHREHLERWFYTCPRAMHRGLGELYVQDPRFTANLDQYGEGVAQYACDAFKANAGR